MKRSEVKLSEAKRSEDLRLGQPVVAVRRQQLGLAPAESLFLYCNSAFAPPPDELVRDVAQCFAVEGVLVLNYCTTPAWG